MDKFKRKFGRKLGWDTFWAIFSQTHRVTLFVSRAFFCRANVDEIISPPLQLAFPANPFE
jgi:hypothetical protein